MDAKAPGIDNVIDCGYAHLLKSEGERRIAETLDRYGIRSVYEPRIPIRDDGVTRYVVPDFYLPDRGIYIEYYGRAGNAEYDKRTRWKESLYAANNVPVLALYPWSLCQNWPKRFLEDLGISGASNPPSSSYQTMRTRPQYGVWPTRTSYTSSRPRLYR